MLEGLCGNKNIQKVLLFLFVNDKCYGAQLQRLLSTPLTSLQNAFGRLERGRIVISYTEGKTKLYRLNPAYPLLTELEQLLKKTYTLLPAQEKKVYSLVQQDHLSKRTQEPLILSFWERLKTVKQFSREAKSRSESGWNGKGRGSITVTKSSDTTLIFQERGSWQLKEQNIDFTNTFRWTLDRSSGMVSLEHLRLGPDQPVFLFHLIPTTDNMLISVDSHLYEEDVYLAQVPWDVYSIRLNWRVIGPKKNEQMECCYI